MISPNKMLKSLTITLVVSVMLTNVAFAQPGGGEGDRDRTGGSQSFESPEFSSPDRPAPSSNGGNLGGPSMGGEAANAGRQGTQPSNQPNRETPDRDSGGNFGGNTGEGGIIAGTNPGREGGGFGGNTGEDGIGTVDNPFGERGSGNIPINFPSENDALPPWMQNMQQGGFGSGINTNRGNNGTLGEIETSRLPSDFASQGAPAAYDDLSALNEANQANAEARNAAQNALQQGTDAINETANNATAAAQNAYDAFWSDYYAAVDATADAYYDTTTSVADYYFDVYVDAVNYTTESIDYYLDYAEQYADYCAVYPFDCYSYTYDYSTNTYYYTGDNSAEPVGTTEIEAITINVSLNTVEPMPSAEAYQAVVLFANDHLAAAVDPLYAGSPTAEMEALLTQLPDEMSALLLNSTTISGETYWALLNGGIAGVMVGDCTDGECMVTEENLSMLLSTESTGAYGLVANASYPGNTSAALQLITDVYPKLEGLLFTELSNVEGYAYVAITAGLGYDQATRSSVSVPKVIYTGVVAINNHPFVYVLVAVGESFTSLLPSVN